MLRTTLYRGAEYSADRVKNCLVWDYLTDEDRENIVKSAADLVNGKLPGSLHWIPWTSSIEGDMNEPEDVLTLEQFNEILSNALKIAIEEKGRELFPEDFKN